MIHLPGDFSEWAIVLCLIPGLFAALAAIGTAAAIGAGIGSAAYTIKEGVEGNWPWNTDPGDYFLGKLKSTAIGAGTGAVTGGVGSFLGGGASAAGGTAGGATTAAQGTAQTALATTGQLGETALGAISSGAGGVQTAAQGLAEAAQQGTGGVLLEAAGRPIQATVDAATSGTSMLPATTGGTLLAGTEAATGGTLAQTLAQAGVRAAVGGGLGTAQAALEGRDPLAGFATGAAGAGTGAFVGGGLDLAMEGMPGFGIPGGPGFDPGGGFIPALAGRAAGGFASQATAVPFLPGPPPMPQPMGIDPMTGLPVQGPYMGQQPYWMRY